jgi:hypothetical protein
MRVCRSSAAAVRWAIFAATCFTVLGFGQQVGPSNPAGSFNVVLLTGCASASTCGYSQGQLPATACNVNNLQPGFCAQPQGAEYANYVSCDTGASSCIRGRIFTDNSCATQALAEFKYVCNQCYQDQGSAAYFRFSCGASGAGGVATLTSGCSDSLCTVNCQTRLFYDYGACAWTNNTVSNGLMIAVNDIASCPTAQWEQYPDCNFPDPQVSVLIPQGYCGTFDPSSDSEQWVSCPGFQNYTSAPWITPFNSTGTSAPTPAPPTTTSSATNAPATTVQPTPVPATPVPGAPVGFSQTSCSDRRYCQSATCGAPDPAAGGSCVAVPNQPFSATYTCQTPNTHTCVHVERYSDALCSQLLYSEATVCNQCVMGPTGNGDNTYLQCDPASGGISVTTQCNSDCSQCAGGATADVISVGQCMPGAGSTYWVFSSRPYICSAVSSALYSGSGCGGTPVQSGVLLPQQSCHQGAIVTCNDNTIPSTPAPTNTLLPANPTMQSGVSLYQCADPHCSLSCAPLLRVAAGACTPVTLSRRPAKASPTTVSFSASYSCSAATGSLQTAAVIDAFSDANCTMVVGQITLPVDTCSLTFASGTYATLTSSGTLMDVCTSSSCTGCTASSQLQLNKCVQGSDGHWHVLQRWVQGPLLVGRELYAGSSCNGAALVSDTVMSNGCDFGGVIANCTSSTSPFPTNAPGSTPTPGGGPNTTPNPGPGPQPLAPSAFAVEFTTTTTAEAFSSALSSYFGATVAIAWINPPVSSCAGTCYAATFKFTTAPANAPSQFWALQATSTGRSILASNFGIDSMAAASDDGPNPNPNPNGPTPNTPRTEEDETQIVIIGCVCGGVLLLVIAVAVLFVRSRSKGVRRGDDYVAGDYVAMGGRQA